MIQKRGHGRVVLTAMILLILIGLPAVATAAEVADDEIGPIVGLGFADENLVGPDKDDTPGPVIGVRWSHLFLDALGTSVLGSYVLNYDGDLAFGDSSEAIVGGSLDWFFLRTKRTRWFLSPGIGWARFAPDNGSSFNRGLASLEIGQKIYSGSGEAAVWWAVRAENTVTKSGLDEEGLLNYKLVGGVLWGVGGPPPDDDADGVPNRKDDCPGTPVGATVDEKGCPKDSDGDGVLDGLDKCADTPKGWPIDASGCPLDTDGDGVFDGKDACPDTPKGAKVDDKGCPIDSDGDGVFDGLDQCPDTPKGAKIDDKGCPVDSDGDGVFDGLDQCPDTPKGTKIDDKGCPVRVEPLFTPEQKTLVLEGVNFEYDSAVLTEGSAAILDKVAASLKDWPEVRVEIGGHTDARGSDRYNQKLSESRAASVRDYLLARGVPDEQMTTKGYGESKPIADNDTEEGRSKNRRVELTRLSEGGE